MEKKIPKVSDSDIERIIERDYKDYGSEYVLKILNKYKTSTEAGKNRIFADILKLANGKIELIQGLIERANLDYRDVISEAEYPNYLKYAFTDDLSEEDEEKIINMDWQQYVDWFER
jgi:predicted transcriptional regulator